MATRVKGGLAGRFRLRRRACNAVVEAAEHVAFLFAEVEFRRKQLVPAVISAGYLPVVCFRLSQKIWYNSCTRTRPTARPNARTQFL